MMSIIRYFSVSITYKHSTVTAISDINVYRRQLCRTDVLELNTKLN